MPDYNTSQSTADANQQDKEFFGRFYAQLWLSGDNTLHAIHSVE